MFKTETFKVEDDPAELAKVMVKAQLGKHARRIGSGSYGDVWGTKHNDIVYKIGNANDNTGYLSFMEVLAKQKTHNPFFPKIYGLRYLKYKMAYREESTFVVAMEKLKRLSSKHTPVVGFFNDELDGEYDDYGVDEAYAVLGVKRSIPKPLATALSVLREANKIANKKCYYGVDWDLHSDNFMLRGNQVVITDPLA